MYGVVLWSDRRQNRAVIWCEDHGDLAYYDGDMPDAEDGAGLDVGDLVRFDVSQGKRMRLVSNPRLVASDKYPTLAGDLRRAGTGQAMSLPRPSGQAQPSKVVELAPRRDATRTGRSYKRNFA